MNERIRELAQQAEIKFEATLEHSGIDTAVIVPADLEKFAELIVRECALVAGIMEHEGRAGIGKQILDSFEVE